MLKLKLTDPRPEYPPAYVANGLVGLRNQVTWRGAVPCNVERCRFALRMVADQRLRSGNSTAGNRHVTARLVEQVPNHGPGDQARAEN